MIFSIILPTIVSSQLETKKTAFESTNELILKVSNITEGETKSFLGKLKFPDDSTHE